MELIDSLIFKRSLLGYVEETTVHVYTTWIRGSQVFVVHQPYNGETSELDALRRGFYFLTYLSLCEFMKGFKESFMTDIPFVTEGIVEHDMSSIRAALYNDGASFDTANIYRIVIREQSDSTVSHKHGHIALLMAKRFGVKLSCAVSEEPVLTNLNDNSRKSTELPYDAAVLIASGLACVGYKSNWANTIRAMFYKPIIDIEVASVKGRELNAFIPDAEWTVAESYPFISHLHTLTFNGNLTKTQVVLME